MRLIDADAVQKDIKKVLEIAQSYDLEEAASFYRAFLEYVEKAPTVDAVSVVRCSGCKFFPTSTKMRKHTASGWTSMECCQKGFATKEKENEAH